MKLNSLHPKPKSALRKRQAVTGHVARRAGVLLARRRASDAGYERIHRQLAFSDPQALQPPALMRWSTEVAVAAPGRHLSQSHATLNAGAAMSGNGAAPPLQLMPQQALPSLVRLLRLRSAMVSPTSCRQRPVAHQAGATVAQLQVVHERLRWRAVLGLNRQLKDQELTSLSQSIDPEPCQPWALH